MKFLVENCNKNKAGIYAIKSKRCERIYIGSTKRFRKRYLEHLQSLRRNKHSSSKLQRFYSKYGESELSFEVIEICDVSMLSQREQYWLDSLDSYEKGFNCNPISGGLIGLKRTKEWIEKISQSKKGKKFSDEHRKNLSIAGKKRRDDIVSYLPKNQKGSKHPMSKLSEQDVLSIRQKFKPKIYTQKMLSEEFGISIGMIKKIVQRKHWKHI